MKKLFITIIFALSLSLNAQKLFDIAVYPEKDTFGRLNFNDVCESHNGYFAVGTQSNALGDAIISVARITYDGILNWKKDFRKVDQQGNQYVWTGEKISYLNNGGCYVFGAESFSFVGLRGLLIKINEAGEMDWFVYLL